MATAQQVIKSALQKILVAGSYGGLVDEDYSDAIFTMNNMMRSLEVDGVRLGYTEVSSVGDLVTIPPGALKGIINNLAIELVPEYGGELQQDTRVAASDGMRTMRRLGKPSMSTSYPGTLPQGSGNEGTGNFLRSSHHFSDDESGLLAASYSYLSASASVAIASAGTPVKVAGSWLDVVSEYFTVDRQGKVTYTATSQENKKITVRLTCGPDTGTNVNYTATIYVNGSAVAISAVSAQASLNNDKQILLTHSRLFNQNDYVEIYLQNDDDTTDFTVSKAEISIG